MLCVLCVMYTISMKGAVARPIPRDYFYSVGIIHCESIFGCTIMVNVLMPVSLQGQIPYLGPNLK